MKIAVLLTCFNRKIKTVNCLKALFQAQDTYNNTSKRQIDLFVFLTEDNCTDGTPEAIKDNFAGKNIKMLHGNGFLFWSGGMRYAWNEALKEKDKWDYYLLLNDDTIVFNNVFDELFYTHKYCTENFKMSGLYSGITCSTIDHNKMTYGGSIYTNNLLGKTLRLIPKETPQLCDVTNANILLVPVSVVDKIGIFWDGYQHACSDYDYALTARKHGIPVLLTSKFCGECDNDHISQKDFKDKILRMSLSERRAFFDNPLHSNKDYLKYIKRNFLFRYPIALIGRNLNLYIPKLYYILHNLR